MGVSPVEVFEFIPERLVRLLFATLLGLFIGLEREWSDKPAGIRTFALIGLLGGVFTIVGGELLVGLGVVFVIVLAVLLGVKSFVTSVEGLSLTTSASMLISYGVGVLSAKGFYLEAVSVAVISSLLLVLKRELHSFAGTLSRSEIKSATEFAILAFVIYPVLPDGRFGPSNAIAPRLIWTLVVAVSGIGLLNYVLVQKYRGRGVALTGFLGGLVNSAAVVGSVAERFDGTSESSQLAVSSVLLANSAMALRNQVIVALFVLSMFFSVGTPLLAIAVTGIVAAYLNGWGNEVDGFRLDTPFRLKNTLLFGVFFLGVVVVSAWAKTMFGGVGFLVTSSVSGLVSSGSATTTAVALVSTGKISAPTAGYGVLLGTLASIFVKVSIVAPTSRRFARLLAVWSIVLSVAGGLGVVLGVTVF